MVEVTRNPLQTATPDKPKGLRGRALKGAVYVLWTLAMAQGIRFVANLVLTRLLFPEAFGLSAVVVLFRDGLVMFTEVGIAQSLIQSPQGDDPEVLNTAWTLQVIRGAALSGVGLLLAWPFAQIYGEPSLLPLLLVGSANSLIAGFWSTSIITLDRHVNARAGLVVEVASRLSGAVYMIVMSWLTGSVWALVVGGLITTVTKLVLSHFWVNVGYRNRFYWSKDAARVLVRFGRWLLFASVAQFLAQEADRAFLAKVAGFAQLGVYTVAMGLSQPGRAVVEKLSSQILFPVLSQVNRESPSRLRNLYYRSRLASDAAILPFVGAGIVLAPWIVDFLYDDRYAAAGWMLQILVIRVAITAVVTPSWNCLFAMGLPRFVFLKSTLRLGWVLLAIPGGFYLWGIKGLVWASALSELPTWLALLPASARRKMLKPERELLAFGFLIAGYLVARGVVALFT